MYFMNILRRFGRSYALHRKAFSYCLIWAATNIVILIVVTSPKKTFSGETIVDLSKNYFQSIDDIVTGGFLVDDKNCKIPDLNPWSPEVLPFINNGATFDCKNRKYFNLTYVSNNMLLINEHVLASYGYELNDIVCCYNTIERIQQSKTNFDKHADTRYRFSDICYKIEESTKPKSGYLMVTCKSASWFAWPWLSYANFHLIAVLPNEHSNDDPGSAILQKLEFWKNYDIFVNTKRKTTNTSTQLTKNEQIYETFANIGKPPNILILGWDSTSRINFHRFMHRTMKTMETLKERSVEMKGYMKVGQNTFPNMVPFLTWYTEDELRPICYSNRWLPQDDCPYVWKVFSENNYLTALLEDSPDLATFNYLKTGFINSPVDIYIRPFMMAAYDNLRNDGCIMYQRPEEIILDYIVDLATLAGSKGIPFFIHSWMTDLTHEDTNNIQTADDLLSETIIQLIQRGVLNNTLLFVMGDHGYRFKEVRSTSSGWFEDKLPAMWITLPEPLIKSNPGWLTSLQYNSNQLTTPFNMHAIFKEILRKYEMSTTILPKTEINSNSSSVRGLSPLSKLPSRTCKEADVPDEYCACTLPVEYKSNTSLIKLAADAVIRSINKDLPPQCKKLFVKTITASGTFTKEVQFNAVAAGRKEIDTIPESIIVALTTTPGEFRYEAIVKYNTSIGEFDRVSEILRANQITTSTSCLSREDKVRFEAYCYC